MSQIVFNREYIKSLKKKLDKLNIDKINTSQFMKLSKQIDMMIKSKGASNKNKIIH